MSRSLLASSVVLMLVLGFSAAASAGTEQAPEITDPANDTSPPSSAAYADVVAGWLVDDATKITTYVKLAQLPPNPPPNMLYIFGFAHHQGSCQSYYTYFWLNGQNGNAPEFKQGVFDDCTQQPLNNSEKATTGVAGTQASPIFKVEFKKSELPMHYKGDVLRNLSALVIDGTSFTAFTACAAGDAACQAAGAVAQQASTQAGFPDAANTQKTYALAQGPEMPAPVVDDLNATENMTMEDGDQAGGEGMDTESATKPTPGFETIALAAAAIIAVGSRRRP